MELMMHYSFNRSDPRDTSRMLTRGQQLQTDLAHLIPACMNNTLDQRTFSLHLTFLVSHRLDYDLICFVEIGLLTERIIVRLGFNKERPLRCRSAAERTVLMRTFMNLNRHCKYHWKLNPIAG